MNMQYIFRPMMSVVFGIGVLSLTLLSGCTEFIDLDLDSTYSRLVVEGSITTDNRAHRIKLTTTTDFFHDGPMPAVSGATVSISDGMQVIELNENPPGSGEYFTPILAGVIGKTYTLNIRLSSPVGGYSEYRAECPLLPSPQPDSIRVVYQPQWGSGFWEVKLYALDPPDRNFYMFQVMKNGKLLSDTLNRWVVVDDRLFNGNYTNGIGVSFLNALRERERVLPGDTITLIMSGITEDFARFIFTARSESSFNTPLFSGPPANVAGNINHGGIGFFAAYQPQYVSTVFRP